MEKKLMKSHNFIFQHNLIKIKFKEDLRRCLHSWKSKKKLVKNFSSVKEEKTEHFKFNFMLEVSKSIFVE